MLDPKSMTPRDRLARLSEIVSLTIIEETHDTLRALWQHLDDTNAVYGGGGRKRHTKCLSRERTSTPARGSPHLAFDWEGTAMGMLDAEAGNLEAMAPRDRLALLSEIVSQTIIEESLSEVGSMPASGDLRGKMLGQLDLIGVSGANMRAQRTRAHVARSQSSFYLVSIQLAGANSFRWCEQDVTAVRGDIFIADSLHAYEVDGERPFRQLIVRLPRPWADARVARPDLIPGALLRRDNPMSQLFASYVRNGFETAAELTADAAEMFATHSVELLALALGERPSGEPRPARALREALFVRAERLIALRFAEHDLTPDRIARALGVSTRLLQRIFAEHGATVMGRVWERRVNQAAELLAMPEASHRSITEIAFACGFNDSAHFSRAFAARFDATPSQWRRLPRFDRTRIELRRHDDHRDERAVKVRKARKSANYPS